MVHIEDDAIVIYAGSEFRVLRGGDFEDQELVEVYKADDPNKLGMFALQAYWISTGKNFGEE